MEKKLKLTQLNKQEMETVAGGSGGGCNCWWCFRDPKRRWVDKSSKRFRR